MANAENCVKNSGHRGEIYHKRKSTTSQFLLSPPSYSFGNHNHIHMDVNGNTRNLHGQNLSAFTRAAVHGVNGTRESMNTMETEKRAKNSTWRMFNFVLEVLLRKSLT